MITVDTSHMTGIIMLDNDTTYVITEFHETETIKTDLKSMFSITIKLLISQHIILIAVVLHFIACCCSNTSIQQDHVFILYLYNITIFNINIFHKTGSNLISLFYFLSENP